MFHHFFVFAKDIQHRAGLLNSLNHLKQINPLMPTQFELQYFDPVPLTRYHHKNGRTLPSRHLHFELTATSAQLFGNILHSYPHLYSVTLLAPAMYHKYNLPPTVHTMSHPALEKNAKTEQLSIQERSSYHSHKQQ